MKFTCSQCKSAYNIKDDRIPKNGGNVRCKVCKHVFKIYPPNYKKKDFPEKQPKTTSTTSLPVIIVTEDQIKKNLLKQILDQYNISATFYDNYNNFDHLKPPEEAEETFKEPVITKTHAPKQQRLTDLLPKNSYSSRRRQIVRDTVSAETLYSLGNDTQSIESLVSKHVNRQQGPLGLDIGTSHIVLAGASNNRIAYKTDLNAFFTIPSLEVTKKTLQAHKIPFFVQDRNIFVCGYPAQDFANIFNADIRRPIEKGLISANEEDGFTVIRAIIEQMIPPAENTGETIAFGVPGTPFDYEASVTYHESVIIQYLKSLGYRPIPVNEGFATVIAELSDDAYTGIGISMGGGMCNVCLSYMAVPIVTFSIRKGGDYIDTQVAQSVGESSTKVKIIKQENLDLTQRATGRIQTALSIFYDDLISFLIGSFIEIIDTTSRIPRITKAMPVVISGGTAMPPGFEDRFANALSGVNFPVRISEVRIAQDPLYTTAKGAMIMAMSGGEIFPGGKHAA
jgi:predicted Zn finger-like uncharacterized protein